MGKILFPVMHGTGGLKQLNLVKVIFSDSVFCVEIFPG